MGNKRKPLTKKIRFEVFKRDKFTCQYCGRSAPDVVLEVDHIKPVAEGGDNDIMNLVTSCAECNRGKGKRELSDDTVIKKQLDQLAELQERREQLDMMLEWRDELANLQNESIDLVCNEFLKATGYKITETGRNSIKSWIKKFSLPLVLESMDIAIETYFMNADQSEDDCSYAFSKIPGICYNTKHRDTVNRPYYAHYLIRVCENKNWFCNKMFIWMVVNRYIHSDDDFERAKKCYSEAGNWTAFKNNLIEEFDVKE